MSKSINHNCSEIGPLTCVFQKVYSIVAYNAQQIQLHNLTGVFQPSSSNCDIMYVYRTTWYKHRCKRSSLAENCLQIIINVKYKLKLLPLFFLLQKLLSLNATFTIWSGIFRRHELLYPFGMSYTATHESNLQVYFDEPSINIYSLVKFGRNLHWAYSVILNEVMPTFLGWLRTTYSLHLFVLYLVMLHVYQKSVFT